MLGRGPDGLIEEGMGDLPWLTQMWEAAGILGCHALDGLDSRPWEME